jgi:hypothetical protein
VTLSTTAACWESPLWSAVAAMVTEWVERVEWLIAALCESVVAAVELRELEIGEVVRVRQLDDAVALCGAEDTTSEWRQVGRARSQQQ